MHGRSHQSASSSFSIESSAIRLQEYFNNLARYIDRDVELERLEELEALASSLGDAEPNPAVLAAVVAAHSWSAYAAAQSKGRRWVAALQALNRTGPLLMRVPLERLHGTRAPLALLRADVLSTYARVVSRIATSRLPDTRPSNSSTEAYASIPKECEALLQLVLTARELMPPEGFSSAAYAHELLAALGRSQLVEHFAAAFLRLAAACPPQPPPSGSASAAPEQSAAASSTGSLPEGNGRHGRRTVQQQLQQQWQDVWQSNAFRVTDMTWKSECWAFSMFVEWLREISHAVVHPAHSFLAPLLSQQPQMTTSSSSSGASGSSSSSSGASAGGVAYAAGGHEDGRSLRPRAHEADVQSLLGGPALQFFLMWVHACAHLGVGLAAQAAGAADAAAAALAAAVQAAGVLGTGRLPPGLVRPLQDVTDPSLQVAERAAAIVVSGLAGVIKVVGFRERSASEEARTQLEPAPLGTAAFEQRQSQLQQLPQQPSPEQQQQLPRSARTVRSGSPLQYPAVHVCDMLQHTLDARGCAAPPVALIRAVTVSANALLLASLQAMRPAQAAARLPRFWRQLRQQLSWELGEGRVNTLHSIAQALKGPRLHPNNAMRGRAGVARSADEVAAPPAAAAAVAQVAAPETCCYSLRCALDAGLLPALERALRIPPGDSTAAAGGSSSCDMLHVHAARETVRYHVLRRSGVWPALLAHGAVAQVVGLVATLKAVAQRGWSEPAPGQARSGASQIDRYACSDFVTLLYQVFDVRACGEAGLQQAPQAQHPAQRPAPQAAQAAASDAAGAGSSHAVAARGGSHLQFDHGRRETGHAPLALHELAAPGGAPLAGSAAAARQALLASFALQQWLPLLLDRAVRLVASLRSGAPAEDPLEGFRLSLVLAVLQLMTRVSVRAAVLAYPTAVGAAACQGAASGAAAAAEGPQATAATAAAEATCTAAAAAAATATAAAAGPDAADAEEEAAPSAALFEPERSWVRDLARTCSPAMARLVDQLGALADGVQPQCSAAAALEVAILDALHAYVSAHEPFGLQLAHADRSTASGEKRISRAARKHGRNSLVAYLDALEAWQQQRQQQQQQQQASADSSAVAEEAAAAAADDAVELSCKAAWLAAVALRREALEGPEWQQARAHARWLLSPATVESQLREAGVVVAGGVSTCRRDGSGSSSGTGPPGAVMLCGNPGCHSMNGPSALIPPGRGKTCARCRRITYCCGACQLSHWREGGHDKECAGLAAATRAADGAQPRG